ncbi:Rec8 like protein-domain-containing protein [Lenzites betulinus]|nr:Rec8 like protein-domain-containing protein [Lenzites betulinus]
MFFSPDLLERRDSGYGLLWLAATLGAKSSFRKLPKRSVLTADISQLCDLIAEPAEPLALRLSSNLMIGVARVYKVKQEIFYSDVTTCFNALKKAVQDLSSMSATAAQLQMGQPTLRAEALTLAADPGNAFGIDFDNIFVVGWEGLTQEARDGEAGGSDDEDFDPKAKRAKSKGKQKQKDAPSSALVEHGRGLHTLDEHHGHLLVDSFSGSISGSAPLGGPGPSSSQFDGGLGLGFDDGLFNLPEGAGGADIGDELARELGEGWGGSALQDMHGVAGEPNPFDLGQDGGAFGLGGNAAGDFTFETHDVDMHPPADAATSPGLHERGSLPPSGSIIVPLAPCSPHGSDGLGTVAAQAGLDGQPVQRKAKRVRLLLDARTELTDDELKMARANYVQEQDLLKRDAAQKKLEKHNSKLIEEMIYGAPKGIEAPVLVDFWLENFRLQVEARSGELHVDIQGEPPRKRPRISDTMLTGGREDASPTRVDDLRMDVDQDMDLGMGVGEFADYQNPTADFNFDSRMRSSEEPGQARRGSRPPSALGSHFDFDPRATQDLSASQRTTFFPWDHAGPSSSVAGAPFDFDGSDGLSALRPVSKRGNSIGSKRDSLLLPGGGTVPPSPADLGLRNSHIGGEDFQFDVPEEEVVEESQEVLTLERNSFNFLEFTKMQARAYPSATSEVPFDDIVPNTTSTRRVAAAAFYHCLVLSTKNLMSVRQDEPYGILKMRVK